MIRQPNLEELQNLGISYWHGQAGQMTHYKHPLGTRTLCGMYFRRAERGVITLNPRSDRIVKCKDCIRLKNIYLKRYIPNGD